jgi:hypothetical protein
MAKATEKPTTLTLAELYSLAERFRARAESRLLTGQPEQQGDLRLASRVLTHLLHTGMIYKTLDFEAGAQ